VITNHDYAASNWHITNVIVENPIWSDPSTAIANPRKSTSAPAGNLTHIISRRHQRISEWDIEVNWAGVLFVACNSKRTSHYGPHMQGFRHVHLHVPANRSTKKMLLVNRLICSDGPQNRRPVCCYRYERHSRVGSLHNGRMQVDSGRARRRDNRHRAPLNFRNAEG
jgi:hypothetical protein